MGRAQGSVLKTLSQLLLCWLSVSDIVFPVPPAGRDSCFFIFSLLSPVKTKTLIRSWIFMIGNCSVCYPLSKYSPQNLVNNCHGDDLVKETYLGDDMVAEMVGVKDHSSWNYSSHTTHINRTYNATYY